MYRRIATVVAVAALAIPTTAAFAATDEDSSGRLSKSESRGAIATTVIPKSLESGGTVTVVVELEGDPTAVVEADSGRELTDGERQTVVDNLQEQQAPVVDAVKDVGGNVQATMQSAYNGVQASVPAEELAAIAALPNVVKIHEVNTYSIDNAVSVPFLGVPQVWQDTGYTGQNIKLAVIDTGIDYTHADFGGPGTVEAYEAADAVDTEPADPALFGPNSPRVKGGYDFVGDDYNANDPDSVPQPDPNPLDCNGHGSHVAGTAGGSGVTATGETYTGPYDASTPSQDWLIGPGVAPQVDLYALRVFGCEGSTDVTVAAIDWAVANDMDVINMSLGSDWGRADDPTAVASTNAIGAGVVVVASAGNSGPSPYIAGSPGSADGVVSVAAVDSTESFPGATVTVNGRAVPAINANGADLSGVGTLTVVRLVDDPATDTENEALGCSVAAYTKNGIVPGGNQLAVMLRGSCARAAKPIFAQQAGAAAALMINTSNDFPPYEGPITANPDNGDEYTVTIPFLGVRSSDAPAFTTGATATIEAAVLPNPGFRGYASFSSNGPRVGDSAVHVDVAAPGVSIVSAGVGAGTGSATISGTSMAAPHVAGVAALVAQAHPRWNAAEVSSAIVTSADPEKVAGQQATRGGVGLVDTAQAVTTQITATGDAFSTDSGRLRQATLSFGFKESWLGFLATKTVTIQNSGSTAVTYTTSAAPSAQSEKATVSTFPSTVTVPAGGKAKVIVLLSAPAGAVGSSTAGPDQFSFYEFSGDVVLTTSASTLRVPYLLVPRSNSRVASPTTGLFRPNETVVDGTASVRLRNNLGALDAAADLFTWGLSDGDGDVEQPEGVTDPLVAAGTDLRAAGTQTALDEDGNEVVVFAVNNHSRWSNAAAVEFDVLVDTDGDGTEDAVVFAADSGLVATGDSNGVTEVFLIPDPHAEKPQLFRTGFYATAPTDSSTILMPVYAEDLGLTSDAGRFDYTVQSFESFSSGEDAFDGWATYDPWNPALSNGQYVTVPRNGSVTVDVEVNAAAVAEQKPLGVMAVVLDNKSGAGEAVLVKIK